ncbi:MAG: hypothetical protein LUG83_00630 [Lachnospiraceae bacterium]|nr:hypothetical protein [Lachnospiraceae bacterium]
MQTFFEKLTHKARASMTVEAAIVFPILLIFFVNLSCMIEMLRLHSNLEAALFNTGNKLSVYGGALLNGDIEDNFNDNSVIQKAKDMAFSYIYVKNTVIEYEGRDYLDNSPLLYGADGLQFIESDIFTSEDTFEITMTYTVAPWINYAGFTPFRMANKYYGHIWNGYRLGNSGESEEDTDTVYIAENASVYHININCTHLRLTIREVAKQQIEGERNKYGGKYTLCDKCGKGIMPDTLYVSEEGNKYHYTKDCPGLTRTVYSMTRAEAEKKFKLCSRCSN